MSYEELVELWANSQLEGKSLEITDEVTNAFISITDNERFLTDVAAAMERIKAERANHKKNNTPEYQTAKRAYDELVARYAESLLNVGVNLMGVHLEDMKTLEECAKYGVDGDLSHFYEDIRKAARSEIAANSCEIDFEESTMKM